MSAMKMLKLARTSFFFQNENKLLILLMSKNGESNQYPRYVSYYCAVNLYFRHHKYPNFTIHQSRYLIFLHGPICTPNSYSSKRDSFFMIDEDNSSGNQKKNQQIK